MYQDSDRAERVASKALKFDTQDSAIYVLIANMYGALKQWDKVAQWRALMKTNGVKKQVYFGLFL